MGMPQALAEQISDVRRRGEACVTERQYRKAFDVLSGVKALVNAWRSQGGADALASANTEDSSPSSRPKHQWLPYFDEASKRKWWWCSDNVRWFYVPISTH